MCINQYSFTNGIMDLHSIADLILGEDFWEDYDLVDEIADNHT